MTSVRVGIVGCGMAGRKHIDAFQSLGSLASVVGICDENRELAQQIGKTSDIEVFENYSDLFDFGIDLFVIATPHATHHKLAIDGLNSNISLLVEKPLASNLSQAKEIAAICAGKKLKCAVGFVHRHRMELQAAHRHITQKDCGEVVYLTDTFWLSGGERLPEWLWNDSEAGLGVLGYSAIHRIDWQGWLANSKVASVYAQTNLDGIYEGSIHGVVASLTFENGVVGSVVGYQPNVDVSKPFISTVIAGSQGLINIKLGQSFEICTAVENYRKSIVQDDQFVKQARDVVNAIVEDREPCSSVYDGVHSAAVVEAIIQSAKTDSRIDVKN